MFYEITAKTKETNANGKEVPVNHKYLTEQGFYAEAEHVILQQHPDNETYAIKKSKLMEVLNSPTDDSRAFVATLQQEYDIDGNKSAMKYDVLLFAEDFDKARQIVREHLRQGYDEMELVKLSESKIEAVL